MCLQNLFKKQINQIIFYFNKLLVIESYKKITSYKSIVRKEKILPDELQTLLKILWDFHEK